MLLLLIFVVLQIPNVGDDFEIFDDFVVDFGDDGKSTWFKGQTGYITSIDMTLSLEEFSSPKVPFLWSRFSLL